MKDDILIHLGLPKTATTAIQRTLHAGREQLAAVGLHYPKPLSHSEPKHQFLVSGLMRGNHQALQEAMDAAPKNQTVLFSAEGLSNHLFDFPEVSLRDFRRHLAPFRSRGILVHRPWEQWLKSYFKQCIVNPPNGQSPHYGFSGTLDAFARQEAVRLFANREDLLLAIRERLGLQRLTVLDYSADIGKSFLAHLNLKPEAMPAIEAANDSLSDVAAETVRQLNRDLRQGPARRLWLAAIAAEDGSHHAVASTLKAGDAASCPRLDPARLRQVQWVADSGLAVEPGALAGFCQRLAGRVSQQSTAEFMKAT